MPEQSGHDDEIDDPMSLPSEVDVAIIGAGAAGLGAAHALQGSGLSVIVLEARARVGGRGHTIQPAPGITFDLGCGWLHSADQNSFVPIAERLHFEIDRTRPPWREQAHEGAFPRQERADFIAALDAFYDRAEAAAESERDSAASAYLEPGNRWNPMIDAISTYINGVELDRVSIHDMDAYEDTEINWRLRRGYGALMAAYGSTCPLALNTQVTLIDHAGTRLRIETSRGTLSANKAIVTVPTNLIADEAIRFHPALPEKLKAARGLPLGLANKVMLALDEPDGLAQGRQSARRHHAHRDGHVSFASVRTTLHRGLFRRPLCPRAGRCRRRRIGRAEHRRDCRISRQRLPPQTEAAGGIALGPRPLRARLLFARAARPRRGTGGTGGAGGWATVLCGGSDLAEFLLDRAWGEGQRRAGRKGSSGVACEELTAHTVIARRVATEQSSFLIVAQGSWIASRSLSSGAHSRDPLARNDDEEAIEFYSITLARISASGTKHSSYFPKIR